MTARFVDFDVVRKRLRGKSIAIVGSAPSCVDNAPGFVDSYDLVVRVNNFKLGGGPGIRTDIHHSFYGSSIRKTAAELRTSGVTLCMCKCPNGKPIESEWHVRTNRPHGIDYRYIYRIRKDFWFCDTFIPTDDHFRVPFDLLGKHQPTSGFAAIYDVLQCDPRSVYLTGFDFFTSGRHNVTDVWRPGQPDDPIAHAPEREAALVFEWTDEFPILLDKKLRELKIKWHRDNRVTA